MLSLFGNSCPSRPHGAHITYICIGRAHLITTMLAGAAADRFLLFHPARNKYKTSLMPSQEAQLVQIGIVTTGLLFLLYGTRGAIESNRIIESNQNRIESSNRINQTGNRDIIEIFCEHYILTFMITYNK